MSRSKVFTEIPRLLSPPKSIKNLIEQQFGRLTVIGYSGEVTKASQLKVVCECSCGPDRYIQAAAYRLLSGNTKSCGCLHTESIVNRNKANATHGAARNGVLTPEYSAWSRMLRRCDHDPNYAGITVCPEWKNNFQAFFDYVGKHPGPGYSLDRYPNKKGNYEPGNVRWASSKEQNRNTKKTRRFSFRGELLTAAEIDEQTGLKLGYDLIYSRIVRHRWPVEKAATTLPDQRLRVSSSPEELTALVRKRYYSMIHRCTNEFSRSYPDYGGRGITVCQHWLDSFENFLADVGLPKSHLYTLERIDNNGNYEPNNVRWATRQEQACNKRNAKFYQLDGTTKTLKEWATLAGTTYRLTVRRVFEGWPLDEALGTPPIIGAKRVKFKPTQTTVSPT